MDDWYQQPLFQYTRDRDGNIEYSLGFKVRAAVWVKPYKRDYVPTDELFNLYYRHGGRMYFWTSKDFIEWREHYREYKTWYQDPVSGYTWGHKKWRE